MKTKRAKGAPGDSDGPKERLARAAPPESSEAPVAEDMRRDEARAEEDAAEAEQNISPSKPFPIVGIGASAGSVPWEHENGNSNKILSSNEELQSTNEELETANEEMTTLNE